jgi:DNA-binding response OmpR family regulator
VTHVLLATDDDILRDEVQAALADEDTQVSRVHRGLEVVDAVAALSPDLVILDLQIGNMGGIATCHALRNEESGGRIGHVKVLLLLDRVHDVFLARTCGADGWLVKPVEAFQLRRTARQVLAGEWRDEPASALA